MTNNDIKEQFLDMLEQHIGIIIKISGAYARDARKDLMQDIILELWKSFKRFDGSCKILTWVYRVALNISMNYKRKQNNSLALVSLSDFKDKEITMWIEGQEDTAEIEILHDSISELNEINKAIILLYLDGNSHAEISEITGISKTNVGTRISRIKSELKRIVNTKN